MLKTEGRAMEVLNISSLVDSFILPEGKEEADLKESFFLGHTYGKLSPNKGIPKVIHQIWINKDNKIPSSYKKEWRESWKKKMSDWEVKVWYKEDIEKLLREKYPKVFEKYKTFHIPVCKADIARLAILHSQGGVYVDLDFECLKPIDKWTKGKNAFLIANDPKLPKSTFVKNSVIASCANHPYFLKVLKNLKVSTVPEDFDWKKTPAKQKKKIETRILRLQTKIENSHSTRKIKQYHREIAVLRKEKEEVTPKSKQEKLLAKETASGRMSYVFNATGPRFLGAPLKQIKARDLSVTLIPLTPFFPYEGKDRFRFMDKTSFEENVYAVHKYTALWMKK